MNCQGININEEIVADKSGYSRHESYNFFVFQISQMWKLDLVSTITSRLHSVHLKHIPISFHTHVTKRIKAQMASHIFCTTFNIDVNLDWTHSA